MRLRILALCIDENGRYSMDTSGIDQGGTHGWGTCEAGEGDIDATLKLIEAKMRYFHEYWAAEAKRRAEKEPT
jgi:hypothetical protein